MKKRTDNLRISATITEADRIKLDEFIAKNDMTISQVVRKALNEYIQKEEAKAL